MEDGRKRGDGGLLLGLEHHIGAGREIRHYAIVHFVQLQPDRNLPHEVRPPARHRHRADGIHVRRQLQPRIGVHAHGGLHSNAKQLRIHLVDAGVDHHRRGIHNLHEHLARVDLVAFPRLSKFHATADRLHDDHSVHGSFQNHPLGVGNGFLQLDLRRLQRYFRIAQVRLLGSSEQRNLGQKLLIARLGLFGGQLEPFRVDV